MIGSTSLHGSACTGAVNDVSCRRLARTLEISVVRNRRPVILHVMPEHQSFEVLTSRELDVLHHVADGGRNAEIATRLGIKEETVKAHVRTILTKLDARSRAHAVAIAIKRGLIPGIALDR